MGEFDVMREKGEMVLLQVLSRANIEMVLKFALEKKLFIFADEVG